MKLTPDAQEILRALEVFVSPGQVVEIRALNVGDGKWTDTHYGYFDHAHLQAAAQAAAKITTATGTYFTLNPVLPALLSRAYNRIKKAGKTDKATSDKEILARHWLPIDLDAKRPAGISTTDEEKAASFRLADEMATHLADLGFPAPVRTDSGNGAHLYYRVELPAKDGGLIEQCLKALNAMFETDQVKVDETMFNAARITKLPGTPVRKGDDTPERPHRMARLLEVPESIQTVPRALLEALAGAVAPPKQEPKEGAGFLDTQARPSFNVDQWLSAHGLTTDLTDWEKWDNGERRVWAVCPMNSDHTDRSAMVYRDNSGKLGFTCHHDGCAGYTWKSLRAKYEPPSDNNGGTWTDSPPEEPEGFDPPPHPADADPAPPRRRLREFALLGSELSNLEIQEQDIFVQEWLYSASITMVYAARGVGKTWWATELARALVTGTAFFDWFVPHPRRVLYVDGEMTLRMLQERFLGLFGGPVPDDLALLSSEPLWINDKPLNLILASDQARVVELLEDLAAEGRRPEVLVFDNLSSLTSGSDENDNSSQDALLSWFTGLRHQGYAIVQVHHAGKSGDQRGASRREDPLDNTVRLTGLDSEGGEGAAFTIEFTKHRGCKKKPAVVSYGLETNAEGRLEWVQLKRLPEYLQALILIRDHSFTSAKELGSAMEITRAAAQKHIKRLREKEFLTPASTGMSVTKKGHLALARYSPDAAA